MSKDDMKETQKVSADIEAEEVEQVSLKKVLAGLRESVSRSAGKGARHAKGSAAPFAGQKYPAKVTLTAPRTSQAEVAKYLPPGARILADQNNRRWLLSFDGQRLSRSWGLYGFNESALMTLRLAWQTWSDSGRTPACPIAGIMG